MKGFYSISELVLHIHIFQKCEGSQNMSHDTLCAVESKLQVWAAEKQLLCSGTMFTHEKFIPASPSVGTDHMVTSIIARSAGSKDIFCMFNETGCHYSYFAPYGCRQGENWSGEWV